MQTPVSQTSLASGHRQRLLSPGQGWVSENAAFPSLPVSSFPTSLVFP